MPKLGKGVNAEGKREQLQYLRDKDVERFMTVLGLHNGSIGEGKEINAFVAEWTDDQVHNIYDNFVTEEDADFYDKGIKEAANKPVEDALKELEGAKVGLNMPTKESFGYDEKLKEIKNMNLSEMALKKEIQALDEAFEYTCLQYEQENGLILFDDEAKRDRLIELKDKLDIRAYDEKTLELEMLAYDKKEAQKEVDEFKGAKSITFGMRFRNFFYRIGHRGEDSKEIKEANQYKELKKRVDDLSKKYSLVESDRDAIKEKNKTAIEERSKEDQTKRFNDLTELARQIVIIVAKEKGNELSEASTIIATNQLLNDKNFKTTVESCDVEGKGIAAGEFYKKLNQTLEDVKAAEKRALEEQEAMKEAAKMDNLNIDMEMDNLNINDLLNEFSEEDKKMPAPEEARLIN